MSNRRATLIDRIRHDGRFDAVILGGGINGIGTFRELAVQGLRVLLVERADFSSGCSAAPSRMIHGGLRYLENGEIGLVRESLRERDALLANAPHLVHPLPTTIPITSTFSGLFNAAAGLVGVTGKPASRGALPIKLGLSLYDFIVRRNRRLPKHQFRSAKATLARWPELMPDLRSSATYHDAWISHPERLALELLADCRRDAPDCIALNYATLAEQDGGYRLSGLGIDAPLTITPRAIVNATGAWLDETLNSLDRATEAPLVAGTKGSHLILDNPRLKAALGGHMVFFENDDGRVCILFPYLGKVLAGSTDIRVDRPGRVRCTPEERDYILGAVQRIFPRIRLDESQIIFSYSGIRPLPKSDHAFTGRISRGHFIHRIDGSIPLFCMVGGKWTTFRAFAEQTADAVLASLNHPRRTDTRPLPIGGGLNFPADPADLAADLCRRFGISPARADHLTGTYGTTSYALLEFCRTRADDTPLIEGLPWTEAEITWLIATEDVQHLADLVLRRTTLAITGALDPRSLDRLTAIAARDLGWSAPQAAAEKAALIAELTEFHDLPAARWAAPSAERKNACV